MNDGNIFNVLICIQLILSKKLNKQNCFQLVDVIQNLLDIVIIHSFSFINKKCQTTGLDENNFYH